MENLHITKKYTFSNKILYEKQIKNTLKKRTSTSILS